MANSRQNLSNLSYIERYPLYIKIFGAAILALILLLFLVLYQVTHRPLPVYLAELPSGQQMALFPSNEPNLQPETLIMWASKASVAAYTFNFINYEQQFALARPYFTDLGWQDYLGSVSGLISNITANKLIVNSVVAGPPVISNQGVLPGRGFVWRVQIPFLVTYQSAGQTEQARYNVLVTMVKVPTTKNPAGVGIDQFVMNKVNL